MSESEVDLSEYYSGGYLLIRAAESEWEILKNDARFPDKLISLSECICHKFDISWGWDSSTPDKHQAALDFGIPEAIMDEFARWCKTEYDTGLKPWNRFYSTAAARRFIQRFLPDTRDLYLIGVGLHRDIELIDFEWHSETNHYLDYALSQLTEQKTALESHGTVLGFEIASYDEFAQFGHSWLCSGLQNDMGELFGIAPNQYGFIPSYVEARQVYDWIEEDDMQGHRGEPEPYYPWLLISYPLTEPDQ